MKATKLLFLVLRVLAIVLILVTGIGFAYDTLSRDGVSGHSVIKLVCFFVAGIAGVAVEHFYRLKSRDARGNSPGAPLTNST